MNISLAFRTYEKRRVSEDILNFLSWDGSEDESYQKILSFLRLSYDEDIMNEIKKMLPGSSTFSYIDLQEMDCDSVEEVNSDSFSNVLGKRRTVDFLEKSPKPKRKKVDSTLGIKINTIKDFIFENERLDFLKTIVLETVFQDVSNQVLNLHYILSSMKLSQSEWALIKSIGPKAFMLMLQGEIFSKEKLLKQIFYDPEISRKTKQHLEEWFHNSDEGSLKKFLIYVTEQTSIPKNGIKFFSGSTFKVCGCGGYLDVPDNLNKKQIFDYMNNVSAGSGSFDLI